MQKEYGGDDKPVNKIAPLVSITVITYRHREYIRQCLDGILMQQTKFPYEIIIGEDGSDDGTTEICKEYADRYPDKIRLFIRDRSLSQFKDSNGKTIRFNGIWTRMSVKGTYVAWCEGDDYWTDPLKLQKQVDFLESHPDYTLCYTGFKVVDKHSKDLPADKYNKMMAESRSGNVFPQLLKGNFILTCTTCFRKEVFLDDLYNNAPHTLDYSMFLTAALTGKCHYIPDKTACYRVLATGQMHSNSYNVLKACDALQRYFGEIWLKKPELVKGSHLKMRRTIANLLCMQLKHYRDDIKVQADAKRILKTYRSLWPWIPVGMLHPIGELISNRTKRMLHLS